MDFHAHQQVGNTVLVAFHSQFLSVEITLQRNKGEVSPVAHCELDSLDRLSKHGRMGRVCSLIVPCLYQWRTSLCFRYLW